MTSSSLSLSSPSSSLLSFDPNKYFMERHECPVCWSPLIAPIFQCFNGHLVCDPCLSQLTHCPICREEYPGRKIRAREFEDVMKKFTNSEDCPYQKFGCPSSLHHEDLVDHEIQCKFRRPKCPAHSLGLDPSSSCPEYLEEDQKWAKHLREIHHVTGIDHYEIGFYVEIPQELCGVTKIKKFPFTMFLLCQHHRFYIRSNVTPDGKFVRWAVTSDDDTKMVDKKVMDLGKIKAVIKFVSFGSGKPVSSTTQSIKWRGPIVTNGEMTFCNSDQNFMSLPIHHMIQSSEPPGGGGEDKSTGHPQWKIMVKLMKAKGTYCQTLNGGDRTNEPPSPVTTAEHAKLTKTNQFTPSAPPRPPPPRASICPPVPLPSAPPVDDLSMSTNSLLPSFDSLNIKSSDPPPPLHFHAIYGSNILMSNNKTVAIATNSNRLRGIASHVFSDRPLIVGEQVLIRLSRSDQMYDCLEVGFTNNNPVVFSILNEEAQEKKLRESVSTLKLTMQGGGYLNFSARADGTIHNEVIGPPIHPMQMTRSTTGQLDPACPLWAFVQLHGRNDQVSLVSVR